MPDNHNPHVQQLLDQITQRTGLTFPPERRRAAVAAVSSLADKPVPELNTSDCRLLLNDTRLFDALIDRLTVGETYFFREVGLLGFLREQIATLLQEHPERHADPVRIWSAGCSTGDEPYSIAMMLNESGLMGTSTILGTDLSSAAIRQAEKGVYRRWSLRGPGAERVRRWLKPVGDEFQLSARIRSLVHFATLNLVEDIYPSPSSRTNDMDFILCRNVLIYFDREIVRRVLDRFYRCLRPGGWLLLGSSDPYPNEESPFVAVSTPHGLAWHRPKVGESTLLPSEVRPTRPDAARRSPRNVISTVSGQESPVEPVLAVHWKQSALSAMKDRNFSDVVALTREYLHDPDAAALHVQAMASLNPGDAAEICATLLESHNSSAELHYLRALLLMGEGRPNEAATAVRKSLYLNRNLIMAHFLQAMLQQQAGDTSTAARSFRNARKLAETLDAAESIPLSDDEAAQDLIAACDRHLRDA